MGATLGEFQMSSREANYHEFETVPVWTKPIWDNTNGERELVNDADPYKWSGDKAPPAIGDHVKIYMNKLGAGTVVGYFAEYGWLGCLVKLDKPPVWWKKQNPDKPPACIFGLDLYPRKLEKAK
jgi:hypothetical protein